ncbi:helix-turn-helix domain-containing protein [Streptomyces liangshanensis]|uniref:Helix-turn-helix domain-containing protein n=1 Tax=Streptomyces liangshanensis TaxID=2717324 RepID=A0A6G9GS28_9ACTN|nr:helix-turn-helix domain-containing protein [Streptomyces liangshanensis]QIQ01010.1 helix-turn-helix domain-containing protein [Streptomyces liangshanensis]
MVVILDVRQVAPAERAEAIREAIWNRVVRVEIEHQPEPDRIAVSGLISDVGRLNVCSVAADATTVRRTPRLARDDRPPSVFLGLQRSGTSMVVQGGREAVLRPGDFALYDTTVPYTLIQPQGIHQHFFRMAQSDLALPPDTLGRLTALRFGAEHPMADLAATYLRRLAEAPHVPDLSVADAVGTASIELIRAALTSRLPDPRPARESLEATLGVRIMEYVGAHLADHDLTAATIARRHNVSVRHLYAILARSGVHLGDWIRTHRLEHCRRELARPGAAAVTIASVARRWGFRDASHFGRVFKEAYGMSPREWRDSRPSARRP